MKTEKYFSIKLLLQNVSTNRLLKHALLNQFRWSKVPGEFHRGEKYKKWKEEECFIKCFVNDTVSNRVFWSRLVNKLEPLHIVYIMQQITKPFNLHSIDRLQFPWFTVSDGERSGLVFLGGDSCSRGHGFESQDRILDGHFLH